MQFRFRILATAFLAAGLISQAVSADPVAVDLPDFELHVVGPDGKPVSQASIEIRASPVPTAEQVGSGEFIKKTTYGVEVKTDEKGLLVVKLPSRPNRFELDLIIPGFGPYVARWSPEDTGQRFLSPFTAELDAGWSVGGIVVDSDGKPVEGAKVQPSIEFKKPPDDHSQLGVGTNIKTDAAGKWHFDSVPKSLTEVTVGITHPAFKADRRSLAQTDFAIERGADPTAKIVLDRGLTVTGKVTDEAGKPIAGAFVHTGSYNERREAKTGDDGSYQLNGCKAGTARIVVWAKDAATDMKELQLGENMEPVDFQMKPGGNVRIRVLDAEGKPVPKARIFFQRWRGQSAYSDFEKINQYADDNGVWKWHEAPLDQFEADICPPNGMQLPNQPLVARDEEYVFHTYPALIISGRVVDAETKEAVEKFQVIPGIRFDPSHMVWDQRNIFAASDGKYLIRQNRENFAFLVQIEAEGYLREISRDVKSNEGQVKVDFELHKSKNLARTVVGKLSPHKGFDGNVDWKLALVSAEIYFPDLPPPAAPQVPADVANDSAKRAIWMLQWQQTDEGKIYAAWADVMKANQEARNSGPGPYFTATVDRDGSFRINDMPLGNYSLSVQFTDINNQRVGSLHNFHFAVPAIDGDRSNEKLDLGEIVLEK